MKIFFPKIMLTGTLLFFTIGLKAQNHDYVITNEGDTLRCEVKYSSFSFGIARYKTVSMTNWKQVLLENFKEFYITKDSTLTRKVFKSNTNAKFMTVIEKGKIDLYEEYVTNSYSNPTTGTNSYSISTTKWYVGKGSVMVKSLKNTDISVVGLFSKSRKSRKNDFAEMIRDNKEVYDKFIADDSFSFEQLRDIIHLYNTGKPLK